MVDPLLEDVNQNDANSPTCSIIVMHYIVSNYPNLVIHNPNLDCSFLSDTFTIK